MDDKILPEDKNHIARLFDKLNQGVFASDYIRRACVQELNGERAARWKVIGNCHFLSCKKQSVVNSHSLSDKMMIDPIAENRYVVGPKVNTFEGRYEVGRVAVNRASVFPGFCQYHENCFVFEESGQISTGIELQMQLFRSICRHLSFARHERDSLVRYCNVMSVKLKGVVDEFVKNEPQIRTEAAALLGHVEKDRLGLFKTIIEQRSKDIAFTLKNWYEPNAHCFGKGLPASMYDELIECPNMQPLVLSGPIPMPKCPRDCHGTPDFSRIIYVNLFPNRRVTHIHLVSFHKYKETLKEIAGKMMDGKFLSSSIECWVIKYCDHWYMSPGFWDKKDDEFKQKFTDALGQQ